MKTKGKGNTRPVIAEMSSEIVGHLHNTVLLSARFGLGLIVATPGAREVVTEDEMMVCLARHARGDWGDVCKEDRKNNDRAIDKHAMLSSSYRAKDGSVFWIITDVDRLMTTVLLPDEY